MPNPVFPTLSQGQDSKFYSVVRENVAMKTKMEGGYVVSRARHTRTPRRTFTTGFSNLTNADRASLESFWDTVRGGSVIFDWTDPVSNVAIPVRFAGDSGLTWKYEGVGYTRLWSVQFTLEEA